MSASQSSRESQCCGFILSPGNCHLTGKGSRLQTIDNIVKGGVEKPQDWESDVLGDQILQVSQTQESQATSLSLSFLR